ncbi:hypothetical protein [Salinimicrobium sp. HB62]|uniref:hypothetical protein n=1 Tax=Salinimicrobium sp. HB62 TaxID=3077781 RepID=UPI002D78A34D|nr:hypothetical protein [Salinimicrobium sp. HB62]
MKKIIDLYINSSIHVALALVSLSLVTMLEFEVEVRENLLLFIFFGAVTGYNFVKYAEVTGLHHRSLAKRLRFIQVLTLICLIGLVVSLFFLSIEIIAWSAIFGAFTLLYALPVFSKKRNLRSISGLKIFIIAFVWAGVTVVLPITGAENVIFEDLLLEVVQRFLLVLVWILPFEIRDLKYDLEMLGTIPQRMGVTPTKILGLILLALVILLELLKSYSASTSTLALGILCLITSIFVISSREEQSRYFTAFWVEALPLLWLGILVILRSF